MEFANQLLPSGAYIFLRLFHRVSFTFPLSQNWWRCRSLTALIIWAAASASSPGIPTAAGTGSSAPKSGRQTSRHLACSWSTSVVWKWNHKKYIKNSFFFYRLCSSASGNRMSMELTHQPFAAEHRWAHGLQNRHPHVSELHSSALSNSFFPCLDYDDGKNVPFLTFSFYLSACTRLCLMQCTYVVYMIKVHERSVYQKSPAAGKENRCSHFCLYTSLQYTHFEHKKVG